MKRSKVSFHIPTIVEEGRLQKPRFSVEEVHCPVSRGSHRSIQFSRPANSGSITSTNFATQCQRLSLGLAPNSLKIAGNQPSSTALTSLVANANVGNNGLCRRRDSWTSGDGEGRKVVMAELTAPTNTAPATSSEDEMLHRIRRRNLAFLRDQSIFSPDYVSFVYNLAQGVLVSVISDL